MSARFFEHDGEPIPGLPARLPEGEALLWQGAPSAAALAWRGLAGRWITAYFGALLTWRLVSGAAEGEDAATLLSAAVWIAGGAGTVLGLIGLYAWLVARTTIYSITSRRVVMRFGVALPVTVNVPFAIVASAGLLRAGDGTGDLVLALDGSDRASYIVFWPHVRPRRYARPEPMMRCLPDAESVGRILAAALAAAARQALAEQPPAPVPAAAAPGLAAAGG